MKDIKHIASIFVDIIVLIVFTIAFWIVANSSLGPLVKRYYADSNSAKINLTILLKFFIFISFVYSLGSTFFKGNTFGKQLFNLKIEKTNKKFIKWYVLILREIALKWFLVLAFPLLLFFNNYYYLALTIFWVIIISNLLLLLFRKITIVDYILNTKVVKKAKEERRPTGQLFLSLSAAIIDFGIVYELSFLASIVLRKYIYIQFLYVFIIVVFLYILTSILFKGKTIGKYFLGIEIDKYLKNEIFLKTFLLRELVLKFTLIFIFPFTIFQILGIVNPFHIFINIIIVVGFIWYLGYSYYGKSWWSLLSHTSKIKKTTKTRTLLFLFFCITSLNLGIYFYIKSENNKQQNYGDKFMGFNYPYNYSTYPDNKDIEKHITFMQKQSTSPKEYILNLFKEYDIVVISENFHGESTQWEMISDLIKDKRFTDKVGHVFTEYGSVIHQNKVDTFLSTTYNNNTDLEKSTACIMDFMSGGFYYFLKDANTFNSQLPDSLKIQVHFTDIIDWNYITSYTRFFTAKNLDKRDSLMANVIIDWYKKTKRKCLVVTNYRHAMGYAGGVKKIKNKPDFFHLTSGNEAQYIYETFPNKTACVMQNGPINGAKAIFFPFFEPINKGIWDKAFKLNKYKSVGFDLRGTPFGRDEFDMYPLRGARTKLKYQDIFTGVIFNKPFIKMKSVGYPYQQYAVEQEYKMNTKEFDSVFIKDFLLQFSNKAHVYNKMNWAKEIVRINYLELFFYFYISLLSYLVLTYHFIKEISKRNE